MISIYFNLFVVRTLLEAISKIPDTTQLQIEQYKEWIQWTIDEKRTFLKQRLESRLSVLYLDTKQYNDALHLITQLVTEVKKMDDKALLVEIQLVESRCHHALQNLPKAKVSQLFQLNVIVLQRFRLL